MLDELLQNITLKAAQATQENALQTLDEIAQLIQGFTGDGLLGLVRKVSARLNTPLFDDELCMLIDAAKADMMRLCINPAAVEEATDPLVRTAITTYCKAHFGLNNPDSEKYMASYHMVVDELRKSAAYRGGN